MNKWILLAALAVSGCASTSSSSVDHSEPFTSIVTKRLPTDPSEEAAGCITFTSHLYCASDKANKAYYLSKEFFADGLSRDNWSQLLELRLYSQDVTLKQAFNSFIKSTKGYRARKVEIFTQKIDSSNVYAVDMLLCNKVSAQCELAYAVFSEQGGKVVASIATERLEIDNSVAQNPEYSSGVDKDYASNRLSELTLIRVKRFL
ncbi:hypothetical protein ACVFI8_14670 [Agarivorans sp. MS3-6]